MATPAFTPLIAAHAVAAGVALVLGGAALLPNRLLGNWLWGRFGG